MAAPVAPVGVAYYGGAYHQPQSAAAAAAAAAAPPGYGATTPAPPLTQSGVVYSAQAAQAFQGAFQGGGAQYGTAPSQRAWY